MATVHRKENTDDIDCLRNILEGFVEGSAPVVWPIHPRTFKRLSEFGLEIPNIIRVIKPVGYLDMVMLEKHARLIATDSGGVQKEAYFHKVPCITLRNETEWVEFKVDNADPQDIGEYLSALANSAALHGKANAYLVWGIEDASHRVVGTRFDPRNVKPRNDTGC